jgi:hypothetical protein
MITHYFSLFVMDQPFLPILGGMISLKKLIFFPPILKKPEEKLNIMKILNIITFFEQLFELSQNKAY